MEFILLFINIFKIVCNFNIFKKCGEKGWKAIIPFLDVYTKFKLFYKKRLFIVYLAIDIALYFSFAMFAVCTMEFMNYYDGGDPYNTAWISNIPMQLVNSTTTFFFMFLFCALIIFIFDTLLYFNMSKSFNKGIGFFIGLVFIDVVFLAILAFFNDNQYIGNPKENNQLNY